MIVVHGQFSKVEKVRYTQFFLNPEHPDGINIHVLCATSGVGVGGLDSPHIMNMLWIKLPPYPLDFVQDIGLTGRVLPPDPTDYSYILYLCIDKFL